MHSVAKKPLTISATIYCFAISYYYYPEPVAVTSPFISYCLRLARPFIQPIQGKMESQQFTSTIFAGLFIVVWAGWCAAAYVTAAYGNEWRIL